MSFDQLPKVLKNVVCEFAFGCKWEETVSSLKMCETIASYDISPVFLRLQMWSWTYGTFMPNPLYCFEPIRRFTGRWSDMIDWHAVNELLYRLDYRRRLVKIGGTRHDWFEKFKNNWLNVRLFDSFYRVMLQSPFPCFKPTYETQRCNQLTNSPFWSARWLLDDYDSWGYL
jgi:hypothetical protein